MAQNTKPDKIISNLARVFIANHLRLCLPTNLRGRARRVLADVAADPRPRAVYVIVGAGASHETLGLPLAAEAARLIQAKLDVPTEFLELELRRLTMQYRLDRDEFETILLALSRFGEQKLLRALKDLFAPRFYVTEFHEILAHMLKHRFIDGIISFNFDEVLDQALDDEIGPENYWRIASDGDLPQIDSQLWDGDHRPRVPLYLKPHGTVSHPSSMRFTREAYFLMPESINKLLRGCLSGRVTIITVGYSMQSIELLDIIRQADKAEEVGLFAIDRMPNVLDHVGIKNQHTLSFQPGALSNVFEKIWRQIQSGLSGRRLVRGIERHRLIASLFEQRNHELLRGSRQTDTLARYHLDRALVEVTLAVAKAKGFVNLSQLESSRVGRYLRQYLRSRPATTETLVTLCRKVGLEQVAYSRETMQLFPPGAVTADPGRLILDRAHWKGARNRMVDSLVALLDSGTESFARFTRLLRVVFDAMYDGYEIEVYRRRDAVYDLVFKEVEDLPSFVAMRVYTLEMLESPWTKLFIIAESAQWLLDEDVKRVIKKQTLPRSIAVIVADEVYKTDVVNEYRNMGVAVSIKSIPWWLHNQHMTIALEENSPTSVLYFERRLRSSAISPVGLREEIDQRAAMNVFFAYWSKAKKYEENREAWLIGKIDIMKTEMELLHGLADGKPTTGIEPKTRNAFPDVTVSSG